MWLFWFQLCANIPNSCIKLLTFTWIHIQHHWVVVKAKASKASEFWQIILQVSKCTKIGETIQKPAPPHHSIHSGLKNELMVAMNTYLKKLKSTLLEFFSLYPHYIAVFGRAIMFEKNSVWAASLKLHIFIDFSPHCTMIKIRSTACVIWTMGRRHAHIDTPPWPFQFDFFIHFRPSFKHITSQKYFYLSDALLSKRCRLFIRP